MTEAEKLNGILAEESPAVLACLSDLGRAVAFPRDVPFQAVQAKGKRYNGTIGQITDGRGQAVPLPSIRKALSGLEREDLTTALLYSPVAGFGEVRRRWRDWQRRDQPESTPSSLPVVTLGLTHGLALIADLFAGVGTPVVIPEPCWGNYRQLFGLRRGARMISAPLLVEGRFDPESVARRLEQLPPGQPAVAIMNFPSNPGGYSPSVQERVQLRSSLAVAAEQRPLIVACDDAYAGLVFEEDIPRHSIFWDLVGAHENLVPVKIDGVTKELSYFGGRVGFVTFSLPPDSESERALENKLMALIRSGVGSPVSTSQAVVLQALRSGELAEQIEAVRSLLQERYAELKRALESVDWDLLVALPFNSGCFALLEIPATLGIESEAVRQHLLKHYDTGVASVPPNLLRVAYSSVEPGSLEELIARVERAVADLARPARLLS